MRHALMGPVALLALGLTGCAGLTPLVDLTALKAPGGDDVSLAKAKDHARDVRDAYRRELLNHTRWRGAASNGLLGIGALALGAGLAKSHSSVFNGLAWAGATTYGSSQLNLRPENEAIYVAGVQTLDCALAAISPLDIGAGRERRIDAARERLSNALAEHGLALGNFEGASASDAALQQAKATASRGLIQPAQQQLAAANQMLGKVRRAGVELINAVDGIRSELDKALLQTVPDPKAALAVVGALNDFAQLAIGGIRKVDAKQAAQADGENKAQNKNLSGGSDRSRLQAAASDGSDLLSALLKAEAELQMSRDALGVEMAGLDGEANPGASAQCKLAGLPPTLGASTSSLKFSAKKSDIQSVVAQGGQPPFTGTLSGGADSGLSLVVPHPFDRRFDVRATDKVEAGDYELVIRDANAIAPKEVRVAINVAAAASAAGTPPETEGQGALASTANSLEKLAAAMPKGKVINLGGHRFEHGGNQVKAQGDKLLLRLQFKCTQGTGTQPALPQDLIRELAKAHGQESAMDALRKAPKNQITAESAPSSCLAMP